MDPKLLEMLSRIGELNSAELAQLEADLIAEFDRIDAETRTAENVALMEEIVTSAEAVRAQVATLATAAGTEEAAESLRTRMHRRVEVGEPDIENVPPSAAPEPERTVAPGKGDESEAGKEPPAREPLDPPVAAPGPENVLPIAASAGRPAIRPSVAHLSSARTPAAQPPARNTDATPSTRSKVIAMRNDKGISSGDEITTLDQLTNLQLSAIRALGRGSGEINYVARAEIDFPDEIRLTGDIESDTRKLANLTSPQSLAASGGICNPVDVDFSLFVASVADEPLGASLPTVAAPRGGLRFVTPPTFTSVGAAGTAIWTEVTDAAATPAPAGGIVPNGSPVKPLQRIVCGVEVEVYVDAIPTRLQFGNMMARFSPEQVAANTELALANAARVRELYRLQKIASYSTSVSSGQLLGASRDLLATMDRAAAAYRYRHRLNRSIPLRVLMPMWTIDMIRADLTRELAHGNDVTESMSLSDAQVTELLLSRGFVATWLLDGTSANASATQVAYGYQGWGVQNVGALNDWPATIAWYLFAEGTFQRLDGGVMDFGVVRDSILDATNDYETFIETFEGIAKRGFESLEIISAVRPNGASAGSVQTATSPNIY